MLLWWVWESERPLEEGEGSDKRLAAKKVADGLFKISLANSSN
jgi:hypothetical protein